MIRLVKGIYCALAWLVIIWPQISLAAIDISTAPKLEISEQLEWCKTPTDWSIERIAAGECKFKSAVSNNLPRGLSLDAFWLRFTLHNANAYEIERWLQVGHPRHQLVSLYQTSENGQWQRIDTGLKVPVAQRPVMDGHPLLPLKLKQSETKTYYVRITSETSIHLNSTLWSPLEFSRVQHSKELFQMLAIGGLMLATLFTLMVYLKTREKTYLFFGGTLFFEMFLDVGYTGLLQVFIWPTSLPYPLSLQALLIGLTIAPFTFFVRNFLNVQGYRGGFNQLLLLAFSVLTLSVLWGVFIHYGEAVPLMSIASILIFIASFGLFFNTWRAGSNPAGYIMLSFGILLAVLIYRSAVAFGLFPYSFILALGFSWYFLLLTPLILVGTLKRSEEFRESMMRSRADAEVRVKFMAQMSHEFRSPLNTILGYAELLSRGIQSSTTNPLVEIKRSGQHLLSMIDEILQHSRGEADQLRLEPTTVNWANFMASIGNNANMMMQSRGNCFHLIQEGEVPVAVMADERRLQQVIENLLSNANRYTQQGEISLTCIGEMVGERRCRLNFTVCDNGLGIKPDELENIFQPFTRGEAGKSSGIDGIGMGLAIVQQLVKAMSGSLNVKSQPGQGSVFSFSIECDLANLNEASIDRRNDLLPKPYTILLVDDDAQNRHFLNLILSDSGFEVITAPSGLAARAHLGKLIDLVITDQFMADGDGWSLLQDWKNYNVPIILLSAADPQRPSTLAESYQFQRTLLKPCDPDVLIATIREVLNIDFLPKFRQISTSQSGVTAPPSQLLMPLQAMIDEGAVTDIIDWLKKFGQDYPEHLAFCEAATAACRELDFSSLRRWTTGRDA